MGEDAVPPLSELLGLSSGSVLSVVGAGGKTSLLWHLGRELRSRGLRVAATSTTHMADEPIPAGFTRVLDDPPGTSVEEVGGILDAGDVPLILRRLAGRKYEGVEPEEVQEMSRLADVVLVEADGARKLSFKIPRPHEPVIPPGTTHMVILMGLDAMGRPIDGATCFHPEMFSPAAAEGDILTPELARKLLFAEGGYMRFAGGGIQVSVLINKADDEKGREEAAGAARRFFHPVVSGVFLARLEEPSWHIRADNGAGPVWGVMLAAGEGKRAGGGKLLMCDGDGVPLVRRAVSNALRSALDGVVLVTGHRSGEMRGLLDSDTSRLRVVENPEYASGMASSLRRGLEALPDGVTGAAVLLGDQPRVGADLIDTVLDRFRTSLAGICRPVSGESKGHPVIFHRDMFGQLAALSGDAGGRGVVGDNRDRTLEVPWPDPEDFTDIDTLDDHEAFVERC